jgi:hypothetical protein
MVRAARYIRAVVFLSIAPLAATGCTRQPAVDSVRPDTEARNLTVAVFENNRRQAVISADAASFYRADKLVVMENITGQTFQKAFSATYKAERLSIGLTDGHMKALTIILQTSDGQNRQIIEAPELVFNKEAALLTAPAAVMSSKGFRVEGEGFILKTTGGGFSFEGRTAGVFTSE